MQNWSVIFELSAIPPLYLLIRTLRMKRTEARTSRQYYNASLLLLLVWTSFAFITTNLPPDQAFVIGIITRLTFLDISLAVFLFVMSSIYFTRTPRAIEILFLATPIIMMFIAFVVDPFAQSYTTMGWRGDFANPMVKYSWLTLISLVMVYSYARLFDILSKIQNKDVKRRMTYFALGFIVALLMGVVLYLIPQAANLPLLSVIGVNLSILITYPAFAPAERQASR